MKKQIVLPFLPGYYWDGDTVKSTGVSIEPTQHINPGNGEIRYYIKPIDWVCALYVRRQGIIDYVNSLN
jgi:hypothetical protein